MTPNQKQRHDYVINESRNRTIKSTHIHDSLIFFFFVSFYFYETNKNTTVTIKSPYIIDKDETNK